MAGIIEMDTKVSNKTMPDQIAFDNDDLDKLANEYAEMTAEINTRMKQKSVVSKDNIRTSDLVNSRDKLKGVLIEMWKQVPVVLPPDEYANWQASLQFDYAKPVDFKGIANPYYTNYTFVRTLSRLPSIEFIKYSKFAQGPVWPIQSRVGNFDHTGDPDFDIIFKEIDKTEHEFQE